MPDFNYGNARNVAGKSVEPEEDQLFQSVIDILVNKGYDRLSDELRNIADNFSNQLETYESEKALCEAALKDAALRIKLAYEGVTDEIREYLRSDHKTNDRSYMYLERLLYRHIYLCFHPKNRNYVLLCAQDNKFPKEMNAIVPRAAGEYFGDILARMILEVSEVKNEQMAEVLACSVCGAIQIFVQQPWFCKEMFMKLTREEPNYAVIEDLLNNMFLRMIKANTQMNKPF